MRGATRISTLAYDLAQWTDRKVEAYRYDDVQERRADGIYENICAQDPHRRVSAAVQRQIDSYAREVLGSPRFAPWLRTYTAWAGEFREGWIPDNYFGRVVLPVIQGPLRDIAQRKTLARRLLKAGDLLPDVAYRIRDQWLDLEGRPLRPSEVEDVVFQHGPRVVVKSDASNQGKGVRVVERGRDDLLSMEGLGDCSVQRMIRQHESFDRFHTGNLTTLRINTLKNEGIPAGWRGGNLRFGRPGSEVIVASSYVKIPIMDDRGTMADYGMLEDWTRVREHPDSGVSLDEVEIPLFREALETCRSLHDGFPHFTLIGWDVGIANDGKLYILELNGVHPGILSIEPVSGPAFADLGWENLWKQQA